VKITELEPVGAEVEQEESGSVQSVFSSGVFGDWHSGKKLLRIDKEGE
jgi:hypothetical protein